MPNIVQKWIYSLSSATPLCLAFAFVWWTEMQTKIIPIVCCVAFVVLVLGFWASFCFAKRSLPPISIHVNNLSPHDGWIVAYIISYLIPFASVALEDFNLYLSGAIALAVVLLAPFVNSAIPHPLLFLKGYHFYEVGTEHGVSGYVLISKRKIRNPHDVKYVKRIFEFLLLDEVIK